MPSIEQTATIVQQVAAASREQASGVEQIRRAMELVDRVTQRNASGAEELSATSEGMSEQAEGLRRTVAFFRLAARDGGAGGLPARASGTARALPGAA